MQAMNAFLLDNLEIIALVAIFGAVVLAVIAVISLVGDRNPAVQRLAGMGTSGNGGSRQDASLRLDDEKIGVFGRALKSIESQLLPSDESELTESRKKMLRAGFHAKSALRIYFFMRLVLGVVFPVLILIILPEVSSMTWERVALVAGVMGIVGIYAPMFWVSYQTSVRQQACRDGFPDALDMLLVSVEAGLGLDAAINRVAAEIGTAHPVLGEHFRRVGSELRAGRSREMALRSMADMIGIEEVGSLVTILIQSELLGTSIASALRVHADDMRLKRLMKAEEKAHMLPVKMTVPLILGILPPLVLVILAPAIINFMRVGGNG
jgi:tight adherence protein C